MKLFNLFFRKTSDLLALSLFLILFASASAQDAVSLYVRQSQIVTCPSLPAGCSVYSCQFASRSPHVSAYAVGNYGGSIMVESYFTGNVIVECDQYYTYYVGNFPYSGHRTSYISVTCRPIYIELSDTYVEMETGDYYSLSFSESPNVPASNPVVTWSSNNPGVANVGTTGRVSAYSPGTATITAHNDAGPDETCTVVVRSVEPTSISVTPGSLSFPKGQSRSLSCNVYPSNASYSLNWSSSNTAVATVSNGTVYGVAPGSATITARISGTSLYDVCYVTVQSINPSSISLPDNKTVNVGHSVTITPTVSPYNADYSISWSSSNTSVATVSNGVVVGVDNGSACITARINGTSLFDTCHVDVVRPTLSLWASSADGWVSPGTAIALSASDNAASIRYTTDGSTPSPNSALYSSPIPVHDSLVLKAIAYHDNYYPSEMLACQYKVNTFQVTSQSPANLSQSSLPTIPSVTFNKLFSQGQLFDDIKLFATSSASSDNVEVPGVKYLADSTLFFIPSDIPSSSTQAYRLLIPAGALLSDDDEPNWEHSVSYTVCSHHGGQSLQRIALAPSDDSLSLTIGNSHVLHPTIYPSTAAYDTLFWLVADSSVVAVSPYGVITALAYGNTTVTLTVQAGDSVFTATSHVTVLAEYTVSTAVEDGIGGSVFGDGSYPYLSQTSVYAVPDPCYHFVGWTDGTSDNPRAFTITCDTTFTAVFAYNDPALGVVSDTACDHYSWKGNAYTLSGVYRFDTLTADGCDSTVSLHLTIYPSSHSNFSERSYESYTWNGISYDQSGDYTQSFSNVYGCDSTVVLHLTILHHDVKITSVDNTRLVVDHYPDDASTYVQYASYQWYCDDVLVKEGDEDYYSNADGSALQGCYHVEACYVDGSGWGSSNIICFHEGIDDDLMTAHFNIYPSPIQAGAAVTITSDLDPSALNGATLNIYSLSGALLCRYNFNQQNAFAMPSTAGIYILNVVGADGTTLHAARIVVK